MIKHKKGKGVWVNADNSIYNSDTPYEPEIIKERVFNEVKEQYEYKTTIVNHKLDWENTEQQLMDLMEIEKIERKNKE